MTIHLNDLLYSVYPRYNDGTVSKSVAVCSQCYENHCKNKKRTPHLLLDPLRFLITQHSVEDVWAAYLRSDVSQVAMVDSLWAKIKPYTVSASDTTPAHMVIEPLPYQHKCFEGLKPQVRNKVLLARLEQMEWMYAFYGPYVENYFENLTVLDTLNMVDNPYLKAPLHSEANVDFIERLLVLHPKKLPLIAEELVTGYHSYLTGYGPKINGLWAWAESFKEPRIIGFVKKLKATERFSDVQTRKEQ